MTESDWRFGPAGRDDAPTLARLHIEAFPGFFLSTLGERFMTLYYGSFEDDPSSLTVVARERDSGRPLGAVVGTAEPAGFYGRLLRRRFVPFGLAAAAAAVRRPSRVPRLLRALRYRGEPPAAGRNWALLSSICVDPTLQGTGLGRELATRWCEEARRRGVRTAYLTTDRDDNDRVNRFYTRLGWRLHDHYSTPEGRLMNRYVLEFDRPDPVN